MLDFFHKLFASDFMPHGMCYYWDPAILWVNVLSDLAIAASYYAIPFLIFYFALKRRDVVFNWIYVAFGVFILACGATHIMGAVTVWNPMYRLDGAIKAVTAVASVATFALLIPMMPLLIRIPSPAELGRVNRRLAAEIEERRAAEEQVRKINEELGGRVAKRAAELAQSESMFRQLAEAMPQMVWMARADGWMEYFNHQWFSYTGTNLAQTGGTQWISVLHPDDRGPALHRWEQCVRRGEPYEFEYRLCDKNGAYRWFLGRGIPVSGMNRAIVKWFGTSTDIDDRKRATESLELAIQELRQGLDRRRQLEDQLLQAQKMEAVGRLAGGVAHDFNNLLTAILGYNEMLREQVRGDPAALEFANEVLRAADRASALTNQLLAFSRRQTATPRVVDLNGLVRNIDKMLRRIIGEDVKLEIHLDPEISPVRVDPSHMDQVIMNLAVNSRDAMPNGGTLTIETAHVRLTEEYAGRHLDMRPGEYVMLAVSDTGTGMDAATRSRLFEPFFTTKGQGKGTGLGLSIVYGIVKQNQGEILVYSEPGHGTVFRIYLPAGEAAVEEPVGESQEPSLAPADETILLVEDEEQVRALTRTILARQGYRVLDAGSAEEALKLVREHAGQVDLLLTDVVMPRMNGAELAREVNALDPAIKVLYMSGYTEHGIAAQGALAPEAPFLQKPFTSAALQNKVREALRA